MYVYQKKNVQQLWLLIKYMEKKSNKNGGIKDINSHLLMVCTHSASCSYCYNCHISTIDK